MIYKEKYIVAHYAKGKGMINTVILEDEPAAADVLRSHMDRYSREHGEKFSLTVYGDAVAFLANYRTDTDIVLMDIELPDIDGMSAAKRLRAVDPVVTIIFVTNMAQFAIKGYSVGALDFLVKPVTYYAFETMMQRAISARAYVQKQEIAVRTTGGLSRITASSVVYVEVRDHRLIYHTDKGVMEGWGSLRALENELSPYGFSRCSNCYLVNLRRVRSVDGGEVSVDGNLLPLSRSRKKGFMQALAENIADSGRS